MGRPVGALIAESILSCGGQIVLPPDYLKGLYALVREAGGVSIADEVQVGFGRVGSHFWAFETQDAVPDIVTMGKPIGNGHPLARRRHNPAQSRSRSRPGWNISTRFGGNPVSCAIGLSVLDVIEEERTASERARARRTPLGGFARAASRNTPSSGMSGGEGSFSGSSSCAAERRSSRRRKKQPISSIA